MNTTGISIPKRKATTPIMLRRGLVGSWILTALLCFSVSLGWQQRQDASKTLGIDAAPSVVAAHQIKIYIETLDADLANELLGRPGEMDSYIKDFDNARVEIGKNLIAAAKNITYGDAELVPIQHIQESLGRYLMTAQAAREAHNRADQDGMLAQYRNGCKILKQDLVPAAEALNIANNSVLQTTYNNQKSESTLTMSLVSLSGVCLLIILVGMQVYLRVKFRRRFNAPLLVATVISTLFVCYTTAAFAANLKDMKGIKEDSYESVLALLDARADAYEANAAESRWLLDRQNKAEHAETFREFTARLARFTGDQTFQNAVAIGQKRNLAFSAELRRGHTPVEAGLVTRSRYPFSGFDGALRRALDNITFPDSNPDRDEPTQSVETLRTFGVYYSLDARIRNLENSGQHAQALAFCLSTKAGDSNWAFFQFDQALGKWLKLNQDWMARYTNNALADINGLQYLSPVVALVVALLAFLGMRSRLNEYN